MNKFKWKQNLGEEFSKSLGTLFDGWEEEKNVNLIYENFISNVKNAAKIVGMVGIKDYKGSSARGNTESAAFFIFYCRYGSIF